MQRWSPPCSGATDRFSILVLRHEDALFRHALSLGLDAGHVGGHGAGCAGPGMGVPGECRDPAHFRIWVGRILRNRCLDHLKSASSRRTASFDRSGGDRGARGSRRAEREGADDLSTGTRSRTAIDEALAALPPDQAEAFVLKHVEGRSYEEMAALTDTSVSALKMRVHRAREDIRGRLEALGIGSM
jgi:RNA polymerase sigma-70 factor, ECF subfamily